MKDIRDIDNKWFFTELPFPLKILLFFVKGDLIILLPLSLLLLTLSAVSLRFMLVMIGVYIAVRYTGEMVYWLSQQFTHDKRYRPSDFGFKKLDNNAIYILYQTYAIAGVVFGMGIAIYALYFMK